MKKKITIVSLEYPPVGGGAGIVAKQLYTDSMLNENTIYNYLLGNGCRDVFSRFLFDYKFFFKNKKKLNDKAISLFILNDLQSILMAGKLLSDNILARSVCIVHGINFRNYLYDKIVFSDKIRRYDKAYYRAISNCKVIICVSRYIEEQFHQVFPEFATKTRVVYCGVSDRNVDISTSNSFTASFDTQYLHLLTVSRIVESKGLINKLHVARTLKEKNIKFRWHVVGKGPDLNTLKNLCVKYNLENEVLFYGYIEREFLSTFYSNCDLFWLMPVKPEAFGLVYLEAQSFGLTCIGSNVGGINESINQSTGLVTNFDNKNEIVDFIKAYRTSAFVRKSNIEFSQRFPSNALILEFDNI